MPQVHVKDDSGALVWVGTFSDIEELEESGLFEKLLLENELPAGYKYAAPPPPPPLLPLFLIILCFASFILFV